MLFTNTLSDKLSLLEIIFRILMAIILGGMIGYERGRDRNRAAGFRTHILVCLGATSISLLEDLLRVELLQFALLHQSVSQFFKIDLSRLGAQVVSGIGFLGAGAIMRDKATVGGLTTAASLWATGCLGLIIGWGFYILAIPCGIAIVVVLLILKRFEKVILPKKFTTTKVAKPYNTLSIEVSLIKDSKYNIYLQSLYTFFDSLNIRVKEFNSNPIEAKVYYKLHFDKSLSPNKVLEKLSSTKYIESFICR